MRTSEWIQVGFAVILATAALIRPLPSERRWITAILAALVIVVVALVRSSAHYIPQRSVSMIRDWLPAGLLLVPYWQTGQFFLEPNIKIQNRLAAFDHWLLPRVAATSGTSRTCIGWSMEVAYLFCYPLVPLGLLALYAFGLRGYVSGFWFVVLVSTYICYAITPFVPALPPRVLDSAQVVSTPPGKARAFNRWILNHGSIHAISFPSAHVASALAVSFILLRVIPIVGLAFLVVAIWISIGAVVGRYHFMLDVLLGAVTALVVFLASYAFLPIAT
jgi:membrane-associated phospholipid phosphatase